MAKKEKDTQIIERDIRTENQSELYARICWYHFREGQTQQEIADRIGLSRVTINKIISDSLKRGYVSIGINTPLGPCLELENSLKQHFDLKEAVVVPAPNDERTVRTTVGLAAGDYISKTLKPKQILGLGWGGTVYAAAHSLQPRDPQGNIIVSLSGGLARSTVINPYDNAAMFARLLSAECYYIAAPMFVENPKLRNELLASKPVRAVIDIAKQMHMTLLTAIDLSPQTWIIKHGALSAEMLKSLVDAGSPGGVSDNYLDSDGNILKHPINDRTISVPLNILRKVGHNILAAGGSYKVPVIRAILRSGLIQVLITEERAARGLLKSI